MKDYVKVGDQRKSAQLRCPISRGQVRHLIRNVPVSANADIHCHFIQRRNMDRFVYHPTTEFMLGSLQGPGID